MFCDISKLCTFWFSGVCLFIYTSEANFYLSSRPVYSGIYLCYSIFSLMCMFCRSCLSFCPFSLQKLVSWRYATITHSFDHCVVCPSSIYGFWLSPSSNSSYPRFFNIKFCVSCFFLIYFQPSYCLPQFTAFDNTIGISKRFLVSFHYYVLIDLIYILSIHYSLSLWLILWLFFW